MTAAPSQSSAYNVAAVRRDFPILEQLVHGRPLIYFDNAASGQKPTAVIEATSRYYERDNANIHRAVHALSQRATGEYELARETVRGFLNANEAAEIILTKGTTDAINLVAFSLGQLLLGPGDEILLTTLEHHSNIVPWQMAAARAGATVRAAKITPAGEIDFDSFTSALSAKTRIVAFTHVSNSLGTINPVDRMIELVRDRAPEAAVLIDGAQWASHGTTDVQALDCDFYTFSGHKIYGPTGIGALYGKRKWLDAIPPYQGGGDMIETVTFEKTTYATLPNKFEAGTPNIAGAVGLTAAIEYVKKIGVERIGRHEHELLLHATELLSPIAGLSIVGTAREKAGVVSFVIAGTSTLDVGTKLDQAGIAVRTGHHCCMPLMIELGLMASGGTTRASFAAFNTRDEVEQLASELKTIAAKRVVVAAPSTGITFAPKFAPSSEASASALKEDFALFDDASGKNEFLLDLGKAVPGDFSTLKTLAQSVQGCMSEVYLLGREKPGERGVFEFAADANADIVRGLIAVLQRLFSGQKASDVLAFDVDGFFRAIGLENFVTSQRRNGLSGMVRRIREIASSIAKGNV